MIINKKNILIGIVISLMSIFGLTIVSAYSINTGFFYAGTSYSSFYDCNITGSRHRVLCHGVDNNQVAPGGVFSKDGFISYIESILGVGDISNSLSERDRFGASFIVHTMLGVIAPHGSAIMPTAAEIAEWEMRVKSGNITVSSESFYYNGANSAFVRHSNGFYDNKFYDESGTADSWVFKNGATVVYVLKKDCANPIGSLPGLPTASNWSLSASTTVDKSTANVGETVSWTHTLSKSGPGTASVDSNIGFLNFSNSDNKGEHTVTSAVGTIRTFSDSYVIKVADAGQQLCERAQYSPQNSDGAIDGRGDYVCMVVNSPPPPKPWSVQGTSNIYVDGGDGDTDINTVEPGQTIHFDHILTATGDATISDWMIRGNGSTEMQNHTNLNPGLTGTGVIARSNDDASKLVGGGTTDNMKHTVVQGDVGSSICQRIEWGPTSSSIPTPTAGTEVCASIPYNFELTATTTVNDSDFAPDSQIYFNYTRTNSGPTKTDRNVKSSTSMTRVPGVATDTISFNTAHAGVGIGENLGYSEINPTETGNDDGSPKSLLPNVKGRSHTIIQDDVGNWICGIIAVNPHSSWDSSDTFSYSCKYISYSYVLTPTITINPSKVIEDGSSFTVTNKIINSGATKSKPSNWNLIEVVTAPNGTVISTTSKGSGSGVVFDKNSTNTVVTIPPITASGEAGTKYCYKLSVSPKSGIDDGTTASQACITVGKKPKVQIWGGNLLAGGFVETSQSVKSGNTFGSWDEYGIFSTGAISGMASGSAFNGLASVSLACPYSYLSFANVPAGGSSCTGAVGSIGNYAISSWSFAEITASFPSGTTINIGTITPNALNSGTYTVAGNLTLNTSTLDIGKSIIIKATGKVTINGDQKYTNGPYTKSSQLPQLVIIANGIDIADDVINVDAWLIAENNINTCSSVAPGVKLTINKCNKPLVVNGPVMTNKLYLHRTAGSGIGPASGDPAEVFNLRPDVYLWSATRASNNGRIQTVYSTELPPRF